MSFVITFLILLFFDDLMRFKNLTNFLFKNDIKIHASIFRHKMELGDFCECVNLKEKILGS